MASAPSGIGLAEALESLDAKLLAAVGGQEAELADWMDRRRQLVEQIVMCGPTFDELTAIDARTRSLQEKFLHWRRSAIMELSAIDRHVRFLNEQNQGQSISGNSRIDVQA